MTCPHHSLAKTGRFGTNRVPIALGWIALVSGPLFALINFPQDNGELTLENEAGMHYDSNIVGNEDGDSDIEVTYSPTLRFTRQSGIIAMDAAVGGAFGRFLDHTGFNYDDWNTSLEVTFPNDETFPYVLTLDAGYNQTSQLDRFLGARTESDVAYLVGYFRYTVNERWAFGLHGSWTDTTYATGGLTDRSIWGTGVDFVYLFSEKLEFEVGYTYADTSSLIDARDHTIRIQAVGELTPTLKGTLGVGYQMRRTSVGNASGPHFNVDLVWSPADHVRVNLGGASGFRTTATGNPGQEYQATLGVEVDLTEVLSASLTLGYRENSYDNFGLDRSDENIFVEAGLAWAIRENASILVSAAYEDNQSDAEGLTYDRFRGGVGADFQF